jgi:hypothetical protein
MLTLLTNIKMTKTIMGLLPINEWEEPVVSYEEPVVSYEEPVVSYR